MNRRLRHFVCVRVDHDQMQRHKKKYQVPTQGNQVLLDPKGEYLADTPPRGKRYDLKMLIGHLDRAIKLYPGNAKTKGDLKLEWFLCNPRDLGYPGHFGAKAIAKLDRKPMLTISGPIPKWLDEPGFLRKHLREFVWTRGSKDGPSRITVEQLEPRERNLATIDLERETAEPLGKSLDKVWLDYMKERPAVARGYIDNPHGNWLKKVVVKVDEEEKRVHEEAMEGTLRPPGRGAKKD